MNNVKHLDAGNFETTISKGVVLLDFWAEWCGPCKMLSPIIEDIANEIGDEAIVAKINVDEAQELAAKFGVRSIPTIFILKEGKVAQQFIGIQDKQTLIQAIHSLT